MKPSFSIEIILIFIVACYIIYTNQGYIFHQLVSKPQLYLWSQKSENKKHIEEFQE